MVYPRESRGLYSLYVWSRGTGTRTPSAWCGVGEPKHVQPHLTDLRALDPSADELLTAAIWTRTHDPSEGFEGELVKVLAIFGVEAADADL